MDGTSRLTDIPTTITLDSVLAYLASHQWKTQRDGDRWLCFGPVDDAGKPILKLVPCDETYVDFPLRLDELIETLSALEQRPPNSIARDMAAATRAPDQLPQTHASLERATSVTEEFIDKIRRRFGGRLLADDVERLATALYPLVTSGELTLSEAPPSSALLGTHQQAAIVASLTAKQLPRRAESQLLTWELCAQVLAQNGQTLAISPHQLDEFYRLALSDDPAEPDRLLEWLDRHAKSHSAEPSHAEPDGMGSGSGGTTGN